MLEIAAGLCLATVALVDGVAPRAGVLGSAYAITAAVLALYAAAALTGRAVATWRLVLRIDRHRVRLRGWPVPMLSADIATGSIQAVRIVQAESSWRDLFWWLAPPLRACHVVRTGPALQLLLDTGRTLTVSVDDPEQALAALGEPAHGGARD
ncbi:hypothetical protein [Catellatospora citrea]|nr:hypothetical protein [Catellatospora citrea]